jgi:chromosome segregation ATPase
VKELVIRLLAAVGLAPAGSVAAQARLVADAKAGSLAWKTKAAEAMARAKSLDAEVKRQAQLIDRLTASAEKLRQRQDEIERLLRVRLVEAEQALGLAREHLMAIDVKLDILEGAANVLDARTRAAMSKQHSGVSAPV